MAFNLRDPGNVMSAYESMINDGVGWLVLSYTSDSYDELALLAYGREGLEGLKQSVYIDRAFIALIALYHEEGQANPGYVLINYVPPSISGVKRARALVHSRRVGAMFKKHQASLTVEDLSSLTTTNLQRALAEPDVPHSVSMGRSFSQPKDLTNKVTSPISTLKPVRRSSSENDASEALPRPPGTNKPSNIFTNLLRRKKHSGDLPPPPTPPKDEEKHDSKSHHHNKTSSNERPRPEPQREQSFSVSEIAVISHAHGSDEIVIKPHRVTAPLDKGLQPVQYTLPLRGKWAPGKMIISNPEERRRLRIEAQKKREREEKEILLEEQRRQAKIKRQKEEQLRLEQEEDARRRASIEEEVKRVTATRRLREQQEKEEEERMRLELEERKRVERERRSEEHRKLEEWRNEQARTASEAARLREEAKKQEEYERKKKIQLAEAKVKGSAREEMLLTGWVTVQWEDSLVWKRRFYRLVGSTLHLQRSPEDANHELDKIINLKGRVRGLKEWDQGHEDLKAIPHSFAVEFADKEVWSMFSDSEEEKYKLLALLQRAAGLQ